MRPQPDGRVYGGAPGSRDHKEALEHLGDVAEVERVVKPLVPTALIYERYGIESNDDGMVLEPELSH